MAEGKSYTIFRGDKSGVVNALPTNLPELGPHDVLIKITHSGLCGTDLLYIPYGISLGHEGVGTVTAIGSMVTTLKVGDRAGGGFHRDSCGHCNYCLSGKDIWCYSRTLFGEGGDSFNTDNGTFGDYFVGKETYVHKIPDTMTSEDAAPLQCAGATVYSALLDTVKPATRVGVVGIGGLGHLAIQYAAAMGAEVVVFSTSSDKEKEAKGFGAKEFYLFTEPEKMEKPVDVLVLTGSRPPNWEKFATKEVLARTGTVVQLAAPHGDLNLPGVATLFNGYNLHTSLVASRQVHEEMLSFSTIHGIRPTIETFPLN